jgi:hypothetical protein
MVEDMEVVKLVIGFIIVVCAGLIVLLFRTEP